MHVANPSIRTILFELSQAQGNSIKLHFGSLSLSLSLLLTQENFILFVIPLGKDGYTESKFRVMENTVRSTSRDFNGGNEVK
ncbi:hypothetical protein L2E82_28502 [Cichorium intybus]|uniref:Uncharacterized protein n=1 Tax=Cichorium intybus TaxID=13427 RepID=A0ACB9CW83_CICIN|nr:hypothetical protein L2E82_28502 [Cichorium intybus]